MNKKPDPERVERLIGSMRVSENLLKELAGLSLGEFLADVHKQGSAKYHFIAAIEAAIDIANHIISRRGLRAAEDYADTFKVMSESGIIAPDFALELQKMARFRNRLVHLYWEVDAEELFRILQSRLGDFEAYIAAIGQSIGGTNQAGSR